MLTSKEFNEMINIKNRIAWILNLSFYPEVEEMVLAGMSAKKIAERIYERDEVQRLDKDFNEVVRDIRFFKRNLPKLKLMEGERYKYEVLQAEKMINELKELIELYRIQKRRIEIDFAIERQVNKLFPTLGKEVSIAMEILKAIAVLKDRLTGKYNFPMTEGERQGRVEEVDVKTAKRVLDVVEQILNISEIKNVNVRELPSGGDDERTQA